MAIKNHAGHIAPSLSCVDILVALYYSVMGTDDHLILSKAHGGYGLYSILADLGKIPKDTWESFDLPGCIERIPEYGIEAGCGALGHGLPMSVGLAWALKLQNKPGRIFCIVGDGELQEGSNWEAIQFGVKHELNNLIIIVDDNGLQAMDFRINIMDRTKYDLSERLVGFGLGVNLVDGHNLLLLQAELSAIPLGRVPITILATTVKGHGLKCAENKPHFHFRVPSSEELEDNRC